MSSNCLQRLIESGKLESDQRGKPAETSPHSLRTNPRQAKTLDLFPPPNRRRHPKNLFHLSLTAKKQVPRSNNDRCRNRAIDASPRVAR
ncbi:hypothetical protein RB2357 [Rhodopirellula baltica SH 1]|uniref:Uncharacterized protein n=1 Tax=Rhodopirellula baltica (strain DSM 10527 / NCIMB 13988 / SH1) TaxID=243090 RepID=Q7UVZ3_RHOBA|nr:hypothetical protein RB2357 [Rhodopirellula baltica SH 1]